MDALFSDLLRSNCKAPPSALIDPQPLEAFIDSHELFGPRVDTNRSHHRPYAAATNNDDQDGDHRMDLVDQSADALAQRTRRDAVLDTVHLQWMCRPAQTGADVLMATITEVLFMHFASKSADASLRLLDSYDERLVQHVVNSARDSGMLSKPSREMGLVNVDDDVMGTRHAGSFALSF